MELDKIFVLLLDNSITASWVILAVLLLRLLLKRAPRRICCLLWALPALRLALPISVESVLSLIPSGETVSPELLTSAAPAISSNIPAIDGAVNPMLSTAFSPSPAASANPMQLLMWAAGVIWLGGLIVMLALCALSTLRLRRSLRFAVRSDNAWMCDAVSSPFILGLLDPKIYLPFNMEADTRCYVMAHENQHIRRGDHYVKLIGYLLLCVYWFDPLVWAAYILLCRDMEVACDEAVIRSMDASERKSYSMALLSCADRRRQLILCPLAFGELGVKERIKNVLNFKRPTVIISALAVLLLVVAALCFLTDPKTEGEPATQPLAAAAESQEEPGVYLTLDMPGVCQLVVSHEGGGGGCANADETAFDPEELIWLEPLDGIEGGLNVLVEAYDGDGRLVDVRSWKLDLNPDKRIELNWESGTKTSSDGESISPLKGEEAERLRQVAVRELKEMYDMGILSTELKIDGDKMSVYMFLNEADQGEEFFGRIWPARYAVNANNTDGYTINLVMDVETEKIYFLSIGAYAGESDQPMPDREPIVSEGKEFYYYDTFGRILPEDITVDQLCQRLNEYWGFDGYTVTGTKYEPYGYDEPAPDGGSPVKDICDKPFLTIYFDGDQEGVPMYVDIINFPGNTNVSIGTNHAVG